MTTLLTDNLPLLAGAPNGIKKLRELILELAVRGKLVPQDPSDEPASELLKRIAEEKTRLVAEEKIKKQKPLAVIADRDKSFPLPKGWAWVRLGDLTLTIMSGGTPSKNVPGYWGGDIPWASVKDLNVYRDLVATQDYITEEGLAAGSKLAHKGEVLVCTRMGLGKIAVAKMDVAINQDLKALKLTAHLNLDYFLNFYRTLSIVGSGMTVAGIKQDELLSFLVPVPPFAEQHRIVAKVDELMALCDRLEAQQADAESAHAQLVQALLESLTQPSDATDFAANWQRLAEHFHTLLTTEPSIDALKKILLRLAVMGKLVSQDPKDEPASELLKRAKIKKKAIAEKWGYRQKKLELSTTEMRSAMPLGWELSALGEFSFVKGGKRIPKGRGFCQVKTPYIYLRVTDMKEHGITLDGLRYIDESLHKELARYTISPQDIYVVIVGATIGKCGIIPVELDGAHLTENAAKIMCGELLKEYLLISVKSSYIQDQFMGKIFQQAQPKLALERIETTVLPIPPIAEQHRIVAKVNQLMALCDQLKTSLTQARQLNEQLASTLVERILTEDVQRTTIATDRQVARTLLAAEITHRLHNQRTFGQRKLQKVIYLAEHAAKLAAIQGAYLRDAAGPHDRQLMNTVEVELRTQQWYQRVERETVGHAYRPLSQAGQHRQEYYSAWSAAEQATIEQVIELMRDWDTDRCEMTVTLYAAWNDFILEGRPVSDDAIVDEVMHSWNDTKLRFGKTEWLAILAEMKKHKILIPTGFGKRTTGGMLSLPGFE